MKLVQEVLEIDVYGTPVQMRYPTMSELKSFSEKVKEDEESVLKFFNFLGMSSDAFDKLTARDIKKITEALAGN